MWNRVLAACCLLLLLTACHQPLIVDSYYIGSHTLASSVIGTPDPRKYCATSGQILNIRWDVPYEQRCDGEEASIQLTLRFCDREEHCETISLSQFRGRYTYCLLDDDYWDSGGVLTYKVELYVGDCLIDRLCHQIWAEMITFDEYETEDRILDNYPWKI